MASSPKFVCLFFFLTIFVSSIQTHARDSQFFSKVTRNRDDATPTTINPNPNNNYFTSNKVDDFVPLNKQEKKDEQPVFLPQTSEETGYGLYGHETGVDAPSTTTTTNSLYNMDENNNNNNNMNNNNNQKYESFNNYYKNNYGNDNHEKNYTPELKGLSYNYNNNNFNDQGKFYDNTNNNNNIDNFNDQGKFYDNNNKFENSNFNENKESRKNYYGGSQINRNGGVEKQGMSDTRFMENGKYYYDVDAENNNKFNNNNYMSYNNNYNTNGYYDGNKETNYEDVYNNNKRYNNNKFYNGNGMQEEFDFDQP